VIFTEIIYLYKNGSWKKEHEVWTPIKSPLIPGFLGLALRNTEL